MSSPINTAMTLATKPVQDEPIFGRVRPFASRRGGSISEKATPTCLVDGSKSIPRTRSDGTSLAGRTSVTPPDGSLTDYKWPLTAHRSLASACDCRLLVL